MSYSDLRSGAHIRFNRREPAREMDFHNVKDAWRALFPDLRFTFAIFNSSHPLSNSCCSFPRTRNDGSLSQACLL